MTNSLLVAGRFSFIRIGLLGASFCWSCQFSDGVLDNTVPFPVGAFAHGWGCRTPLHLDIEH